MRPTLEDRFWSKVSKGHSIECWEWMASKFNTGYGQFSVNENGVHKNKLAHRIAYELSIGPIPVGLVIDHLCRNKGCCNPGHMEPVEHAVNTKRGVAHENSRKKNDARTHCRKMGHPLSGGNTIWRVVNGYLSKICRECQRIRSANQRDRVRANFPK